MRTFTEREALIRRRTKMKVYKAKWYLLHPEEAKAMFRRNHQSRRRRKAPQLRANDALRNAVRSGRLIKPEVCDQCKLAVPARMLHGHHSDYDKRLEVRWLCETCHWAHHNQ